jgi:hypothetical protein
MNPADPGAADSHLPVHLGDAGAVKVQAARQVRLFMRQQPRDVAGARKRVVQEHHPVRGPWLGLRSGSGSWVDKLGIQDWTAGAVLAGRQRQICLSMAAVVPFAGAGSGVRPAEAGVHPVL